jgi:hypothetical protein
MRLLCLALIALCVPAVALATPSPTSRREHRGGSTKGRATQTERASVAKTASSDPQRQDPAAKPATATPSPGAGPATTPTVLASPTAGVQSSLPATASAPTPVVVGTTYFVSSSGSDLNSGTSPAQAWRTVDRVNRQVLAAGDAVLFAGGQTFSDSDLEPAASGTAGQPIVYGSYGQGDAVLSQGTWFVQDHLLFDHLQFASTFFGGSESKGSSNDITVQNCVFALPSGNQKLGIYTNGDDWVLENNVVQNTGLSGMLLNGDDYRVVGNTIDNVGLYDAGYNAHGIYLDASDATLTDNTITRFSESAVSARYRDSTIERNYMSGGQIGIDFYQTDAHAGTSHWLDNTIKNTSDGGIYVSSDGDYPLRESFVIRSNAINTAGAPTNLRASTTGSYNVAGNIPT